MTRTAVRLLVSVLVGLLAGPSLAHAQMTAADLITRLDQLESQIRQLTGSVEQLQFRNQQLEQTLRKVQEDNEFRFQELGGKSAPRGAPPARPNSAPPPQYPQQAQPQYQPPPYQPPPAAPSGRRSDVFDPTQNPAAPGAPRTLGSMSQAAAEPPPLTEQPIGARAGRGAGSPLDLSIMSANAANDPRLAPSSAGSDGGLLPPPPPRNPSATGGRVATLPPTQSSRDEYDLAYGYILRKDYALAEEAFRDFLKKYPNDRLGADAQYWLGESMFLRQNYRDAADAFLTMTKKYEQSPKAAEALLRLGQALAALREKELACATLGEVGRKYPRASTSVKQAVEREQKRVRC